MNEMMQVQRFYNGIVQARRLNAPTYTEAAKDLAQAYVPVYEA